jgi:dUTP pyrophosphatase
MIVRIVNNSSNPLPEYQSAHAAGMDLYADLAADVILKPLERALIPTGIHIELPEGFEAQVRPRSGLALQYGITLLNSPGTIDADYRGEIKVILVNISHQEYRVKNGDRIAQMIIAPFEKITWMQKDRLNETERKHGGFGSTGR